MAKAPAFLLYAADFYMDTNTWTIDEIGIYTRLLFSEWVNGPLPGDETRLARAAGCSVKRFRGGWGQVKLKFSETEDGKLYNERLEIVRKEQQEYQEKQKVKGKKSAEKRWGKGVTTVTDSVTTDAQPEGNSSSSSSSSISKERVIGKKNIFIKPALSDVTAYCIERKNRVNPKAFMDHYESNGWKVGKNPMRDWKAAVRTWEHNNGSGRINPGGANQIAEKEGRPRSDGAEYPTDHEF